MAGRLVIFSGPSGVGKDTILDAWMRRNPNVERVVAFTTRRQRPLEKDGVDYRFVILERFRELISADAFLEYKEVFGNLYGTPLRETEEILLAGRIAVLKIDVQGALAVMKLRQDALSVFIMPPNLEELKRRILERATDAPEIIEQRFRIATEEMALASEYQHVLVNRDVEEVVDHLEGIVG